MAIIRVFCKRVCGALAALGICLPCAQSFADADMACPDFPSKFWNKNAKTTELNLVSPRLMNDEQLLEAAALIKSGDINQGQRILNNVWLTMEESKQYEGARALGKLLSIGYISYKRALTPSELNNPLIAALNAMNEDAVITHFNNYEVEISSRSLTLSYRIDL